MVILDTFGGKKMIFDGLYMDGNLKLISGWHIAILKQTKMESSRLVW